MHIFSSDLQRAYRTAEAIRDAQNTALEEQSGAEARVEIVQLAELREKDFGTLEGKRGREDTSSASGLAEDIHVESETTEALAIRAKRFLDAVLFPLLKELLSSESRQSIVIVAHGLILSAVWPIFLARTGSDGLATGAAPDMEAALINTGYHEAIVRPKHSSSKDPSAASASSSKDNGTKTEWLEATVEIRAVNCKDHLAGLKKTRGGIGSAKFDAKQRTMDSFFSPPAKKRKAEEG